MTDRSDDEKRRDEILRRMLKTPPKPNKPTPKGGASKASPKPRGKSDAS